MMKKLPPLFRTVIEYVLVIFLILWSGGYATYGLFQLWPYVLLVLVGAYYFLYFRKVSTGGLILLLLLGAVLFMQAIHFSGPLTSVIKPVVSYFVILMVSKITRKSFGAVVIRVTAFFALVSLFFWVIDCIPAGHAALLQLADSLPQFGAETLNDIEGSSANVLNQKSLYFYSVLDVSDKAREISLSLARNSGPFWEPGLFAFYLLLSLLFNLFVYNRAIYSPVNILLTLTLLTTLSTTAYIALAVVLAGYLLRSDRKKYVKVLEIAALAVVCLFVSRLPFMADKITGAIDETDIANSRIGALFYHIPQILQSPFIGYGAFLSEEFNDLEFSPCGWTDMMRVWGIPMTLLLWVLIYRFFSYYITGRHRKVKCFTALLCIVVICYSETIMTMPLLFAMYFTGVSKPFARAGATGAKTRQQNKLPESDAEK